SSLWQRNNVRRSRTRSILDQAAWPNANQNNFTSSEPHRFCADIARSSPPAGASPVRGQKSVAGYQSGSCGGRRVACVAEPRKCFYRVGTEPNKDKKRKQARSAPHDQTRRRRIHADNCFARWLEALSAGPGFK